jgi:DNA repair exonuclease SbcCD ATPase subunit
MTCLENYFKQHNDKDRFTSQIELKSIITLNDLIRNSIENKLVIAEILLFVISVCTKRNYYIEKIEKLGESENTTKYISGFFIYIEKYINTANDESMSMMTNNHFYKYKEETDILITDLRNKNEQLEANLLGLELKFKDKEKELDIAKSNNQNNVKAQEELFRDTMMYTQLKNELAVKDMEIIDIKRANDLINKKNEDNIKKLKEKIESFKDIQDEYMSMKTQNERLSNKLKELSSKQNEQDELLKAIDSKNKQIDALLNEKKTYMSQIDLLAKELKQAQEKIRNSEFERKKLEIEVNDLRKEYSRHENHLLSDKELNLSFKRSEVDDVKLIDIGGESMIFESNEVKQLVLEKDNLIVTINGLKTQIDKSASEKERTIFEKEKLEVEKQKLEVENDKIRFQLVYIEKEIKKSEEEKVELIKKIEKIEKSDKMTIDTLKNELTNSKSVVKRISLEKHNLQDEVKGLQTENDKLKTDVMMRKKVIIILLSYHLKTQSI